MRTSVVVVPTVSSETTRFAASEASSPPGGSSTTRPPATSTTGTITVTNGISVRAPSGSRSDQHVVRRQVLEADDLAEHATVDVLRAQPGELVRVPGVVLVGRVLVDDELGPAQSPRPSSGR